MPVWLYRKIHIKARKEYNNIQGKMHFQQWACAYSTHPVSLTI
jgi:hypothetical protein